MNCNLLVSVQRSKTKGSNNAVPNELEELLEMSCAEPAYGPRFYRCLLRSEIHALCLASDIRRSGGKVRFVMWTGADGVQVIPCFSSIKLVSRALNPTIAAYKIAGRQLLEATRGATIVLNPNEPSSCRLAPYEIAALLETGAVSRPEIETLKEDKSFMFDVAENPPVGLMHSLIVLYSQHPLVQRAHLVCFWPDSEPEKRAYLICIRLDDGAGKGKAEKVVRESAAVMVDVPPEMSADILTFTSDDETLQLVGQLAAPFYERAMGERLVASVSGRSN